MTQAKPHISTLELHVPPGDAGGFEMWRMGVSPLFDMEANPFGARDDFYFHGITHQFAETRVSSAVSAATRYDRNRNAIARGGLDNVMVQTYLAGSYLLTTPGKETRVETGDLCILDLAQTCTLVTTPYAQLNIVLQRRALTEFLPDIERLHGAVLRRGAPMANMLASHLQALLDEAPRSSVAQAGAAARATAALVAAAFVEISEPGRAGTHKAAAAAPLQALRRMIEDDLDNTGLTPDFLARRFGMSRATLYRLFEPMGGVRNYIQHRRLARAHRALVDPANRGERIGAIASRHGFPSDSVFSRAFRQTYGVSPSQLRSHGDKGAIAHDAIREHDDDFTRLYRSLLAPDN